MSAQTPTSIFVVSGIYFDVINPAPADVFAIDMAWGMAGFPRYNCHTLQPWDVLSHTGLVFQLAMADNKGNIPDLNKLGLLLHDSPEGYIGDMTRPLKSVMPEYQRVESHLLDVILARFGVRANQIDWDFVKRYDNQALWIERQIFMPWFDKNVDTIYTNCKQYDMPSLPKLNKATVEQYFSILRECAINVGTLDLRELFNVPPYLNLQVAAQTFGAPAQQPTYQGQQAPSRYQYDPRTNDGFIDVPASQASLTREEVLLKSKQGTDLDDARNNAGLLLGGRSTEQSAPPIDLYGAR